MPVLRVACIYFVCLANSHKLGGRCIAGTIIAARNDTRPLLNAQGRPKWVRPVERDTEGNAIPKYVADNIHIGDIVEIVNPVACPSFAQQENVYYDALNVIGKINDYSVLKTYLGGLRGGILGNYGKAVIPEKYKNLNYSILLIHPECVSFYLQERTEQNKKPQPRVKLKLAGHEYDLPITDPTYYSLVSQNLEKANAPGNYYITVSLGLEHEGYHSKLAACIIKISAGTIDEIDDGNVYIDENVPFPTIEDMPPETYLPVFDVIGRPRAQTKQKEKSGNSTNTRTVINGRMFHTFSEPLNLDEKADKDSEQMRKERRIHFESLAGFDYVIKSLPNDKDIEFFKPRDVEEPKKRLNDLPKRYFKFDDKFSPNKTIGDASSIFLVKACRPVKISIVRKDVICFFVSKSYGLLCEPGIQKELSLRASMRDLNRMANKLSSDNHTNLTAVNEDDLFPFYRHIKFNDVFDFLTEQSRRDALIVSSKELNDLKAKESSELKISELVAFEQNNINYEERNNKEAVNEAFQSFYSFLLNHSPYAEDFYAKVFVLIDQLKITEEIWKKELTKLCGFLVYDEVLELESIESHYAYIDEAGNTIIALPNDTIGFTQLPVNKMVIWIRRHPKLTWRRLFTLADITGYVYYTWEVGQNEVSYRYLNEEGVISGPLFDKNGVLIKGKSYMTVLGVREENTEIEKIQIKTTPAELPAVVALDGTVIPPSRLSTLKDGKISCFYYAINKGKQKYLITIDGEHEIAETLYALIKSYH